MEQVTDVHTQVEGFDLTLERRALSWFQSLEPSVKISLSSLEKDFIAAFSKMGIKHNVVARIYTLESSVIISLSSLKKEFIAAFSKMGIKHNVVAHIYTFKQKEHETMCGGANRLRQYSTRCPMEEKPS